MCPSLRSAVSLAAPAAVALLSACSTDAPVGTNAPYAGAPSLARAGHDAPGAHRQYGPPARVGNGMARAYVVLDAKAGRAPVELGVALDERALEGLPVDHAMHMYDLRLPAQAPAPYRFVMLDWNAHGHPPAGVYSAPHFDFHFYMVSAAERNAIVPSDPQYAAKANDLPTGGYVPAGYLVPGPASEQAVPMMGVHWFDSRAAELQGLFGNPAGYQPFTKTFIYGSWAGRFTFLEPMVTRAYLLTKPDVVTPISVPQSVAEPGYYPSAYRVTYDARAKEYRVALTGMTAHR